MSKKVAYENGQRVGSSNTIIHAGSIAPPLGSRTPNAAPNRNISPVQFKNARSFEQQRMF